MPDALVSSPMLRPSRIDTPSATRILALERNLPLAPIPPERELQARAIRLQLRAVQVMDGLEGFWGTSIGAATGVYLITSVVDGLSDDPILFQAKTYQGISNHDMLPLGPAHEPAATFNVYLREGEMPRVLSFSLLVLRSNEGLREMATLFGELRADKRYQGLAGIIKTAVAATNPTYGIVWQAAEEVIGLVGDYLKAKPDDQLGYYQANYTNAFDNLGMGRHPHPQDANTMLVDKIRFAYEINALASETPPPDEKED